MCSLWKMCSWNNNKKAEPKQLQWRIPKRVECKKLVERKIASWTKSKNIEHKFALWIELKQTLWNEISIYWILLPLACHTLWNLRKIRCKAAGESWVDPILKQLNFYVLQRWLSQIPCINPFPFEWVLRALIDFTLSNARRFYSSMGNLSDGKGLKRFYFL